MAQATFCTLYCLKQQALLGGKLTYRISENCGICISWPRVKYRLSAPAHGCSSRATSSEAALTCQELLQELLELDNVLQPSEYLSLHLRGRLPAEGIHHLRTQSHAHTRHCSRSKLLSDRLWIESVKRKCFRQAPQREAPWTTAAREQENSPAAGAHTLGSHVLFCPSLDERWAEFSTFLYFCFFNCGVEMQLCG